MILLIDDVIEYCFLFSITFPQKFPYNMFIHSILAFHLAVVSNGSKLSLSVWMTTKAVRRPEKKGLVGRALLWHFFSAIVQLTSHFWANRAPPEFLTV